MRAEIETLGANPTPLARITRADSDDQLLRSWLRARANRSPETYRAYERDANAFLAFAGRPLRAITIEDLQDFAESLGKTYAPDSQRVMIARIKSLLSYGHKSGYLQFNVGLAYGLRRPEDTLAQRILDEEFVLKMITLEPNERNKLLIRLSYASAGRVSEIVRLEWRHLHDNGDGGGVVSLYGKGGKTRAVKIPAKLWRDLSKVRGANDAPVFPSRKKNTVRDGHLTTVQAWRIVRAAARRVDPDSKAGPHFLRHSHASHALDRDAPITVIQDTLGHSDATTTRRYAKHRKTVSSSDYLVIS